MTDISINGEFPPAIYADWLQSATNIVDEAGVGEVGTIIAEYEGSLESKESEIPQDDFTASLISRLSQDPEYRLKMKKLIEARNAAARAVVETWRLFDEVCETREESESVISNALSDEYDARWAAKAAQEA